MIKITIATFILLVTLTTSTELSHPKPIPEFYNNIHIIRYNSDKPIDLDVLRVIEITGWDMEYAELFVDESRLRNVSIFEESLPIVTVETGYTYKFDLVNKKNRNGTIDKGAFQINDITLGEVIEGLQVEGYEFKSWSRLNPRFNITAGIFRIAHLKEHYNLEGQKLFTSYNYGVTGGRQYASRNGTYETDYSRKIEIAKKHLTNY